MSTRVPSGASPLRVALGLLLAALLWLGAFVWPTPYRDLPLRPAVVIPHAPRPLALREYRMTGRVEVLTADGWHSLGALRAMAQLDSIARGTGP